MKKINDMQRLKVHLEKNQEIGIEYLKYQTYVVNLLYPIERLCYIFLPHRLIYYKRLKIVIGKQIPVL
ncbi:MAG: hypothetical protein MIO93_02840 [ANME-2 cluster archaeon]|jgi:hypothetical protein|nr:hypothetical protein [ANME-2 cluster archaeon]